MSKKSNIAVLRKNGTIDSIYCYSNGYLYQNGVLLNYFYRDIRKINNLINLGDISFLGRRVNPEPDFTHNFDYENRQQEITVAYHRDRNEDEKICNKKTFKNINEYKKYFLKSCEEIAYLYDENSQQWFYSELLNNSSDIKFESLYDKLLVMGKIHPIDKEKDSLIKEIIKCELEEDYDKFYNSYESKEDAYFNFDKLLSSKNGITNLVDIISVNLGEIARHGDLSEPITKRNYQNGIRLIESLNKFAKNKFQDLKLDNEK